MFGGLLPDVPAEPESEQPEQPEQPDEPAPTTPDTPEDAQADTSGDVDYLTIREQRSVLADVTAGVISKPGARVLLC